jgi:hypothetical protein
MCTGWHGMHVRYICMYVCISASLTLVVAVRSAPFSNSREQVAVWPYQAAQCKAVRPSYNNRETERDRSGQGHTGKKQGHTGDGTVGPVRVG